MVRNMGTLDRSIRTVIVLAVIVAWATGNLSGLPLLLGGLVAVIFAATSLVGFCPLYRLVGVSTCPAS